MSNLVIETTGLTKQYGSRRGIVDVSIGVAEGEAFGFLGPNGAGKTTTIRVLLGFLRPTSGSALLFGHDAFTDAARIHRNVAYLGSDPGFLGELTSAQQLDYLAALRASPAGAGNSSPSAWSWTPRSVSASSAVATARRSASWRRSWATSRC